MFLVYIDFTRVIVGVAPDARDQLDQPFIKLGREKEEKEEKNSNPFPLTFQISTPITEILTGSVFAFFSSISFCFSLSQLTLFLINLIQVIRRSCLRNVFLTSMHP
jgi:hypothetical protein